MVNIKFLFILLSLQISLIITDNEIKLTYNDDGLPYTSVCFGSKTLCLSLKLDTDNIDTLVHSSTRKNDIKNKYDQSASKKSEIMKENVEIKYNTKTLKADLIKDAIEINSMEIKKGFFYSIKEGECESIDKIEGIFGLGYPNTASQEKNSLMIQLYVNGHLDSKIWTIDFSEKNGQIFLQKKIEEKAEGIELDLQNNDEGHWIIPIKSILLGKNKKKDENIDFDKDTKIKISTSENKSSIDLNLLKKIGEKYFKKLVEKSECKLEEKDKKYTTYICKNNNYEDINSISMIFGDFGMNIPKENVLIQNSNKEYEFILANYNGEKNNVLGMDILKNKKIVFDVENMKLGIYGENIFNVEKESKDEAPIIPKEDIEKEKEKEKERQRQQELEKEKEKEKQRQQELEREKEKEKQRQQEIEKEKQRQQEQNNQNNNNNQNTKNSDSKQEEPQPEKKSGGSVLKKILIVIVVILVLFILWNLYKRYLRRRAKMKFPFKSYSDSNTNVNGIQLISDQ